MPAMNKNWNDRADKDLFFTILSVKNIGVISGAEWTIIGNHMRSLGYGFTNEGCRQHFQGLRRAQNKAESNGMKADNPRSVDPNVNPITRRPGPGRGRPRKQPPAPISGLPSAASGLPHQQLQAQPQDISDQAMIQPTPPASQSQPINPLQPQPQPQAQTTTQTAAQAQTQPPPQPQTQASSHMTGVQQTPVPVPIAPVTISSSTPAPPQAVVQDDDLNLDDHPDEGGDDEGDSPEQAAKRPRLDSQPADPTDQQMDEDVVLALAGHPPPDVGSYGATDFGYGEA